jgi:3D (Asp-Asp-Asp) domain-containing protein
MIGKRGRWLPRASNKTRSAMWLAVCLLACLAGNAFAGPSAIVITVKVDGQVMQATTSGTTVEAALAELRIPLSSLDRSLPDADCALKEGDTIVIQRAATGVVEVQREIPYRTVSRQDRRMGRPVVLSPGRPGLVREQVKVWSREGKEIRREVVSSRIVRKPEPKVVVQAPPGLASRGAMPSRRLVLVATAYEPGPGSCGKYADGYTAIGVRATRGVAAVDPRVIPLGTRLYVDGYGYAIAADVGGAIKGNRIDLCFDTVREAIAFGRKTVVAYVLE